MATPLGGGAGNKFILNCQNQHASTEILQGEVVELDITLVLTMDGLNNDPVMGVVPNTIADDADGAAGRALGIAMENIAAGDFGPICVFGIVQVLMDDTAAIGAVVGIDPGTPVRVSDAASATFQAPMGIMLETGVQAELKFAMVDFIGGSWGGSDPAGDGSPNDFWGVSF